jgi:outer membrane protein TolC
MGATTAKKKPAPTQQRDTTVEDIDALDSMLQAKTPGPPKKEEVSRLAKLILEHSPTVKGSFDQFQLGTLQLANTYSAFFPNMTASTLIGPKHEWPQVDGTGNTYGNVTLQLNEALYDNGVNLTKYDINGRAANRLRLEYEYTRDQTLLAAVQAYFDWSQSLQAQELDDAKKKILNRQFMFVSSQFRQGLSSRRDVLRLEGDIRRTQLDQMHRETEIKVNRAKLLDLLGVSEEVFQKEDVRGEETGVIDEPGAGTDRPLILSDHRRLKILRSREEESGLGIRLAERDYLPHLDLKADANYTNDQYLQPARNFDTNYTSYWEALVVVSWTVFDWGIKHRNIEIAKVTTDTVMQADRQEELDLEVQLKTVMQSLNELKETFLKSHELVTLEQQNYNALENDYRNGRTSYLDLIGSINTFIDARSRFMTAYFDLRRQKLNYDFHTGEIYTNLTTQ